VALPPLLRGEEIVSTDVETPLAELRSRGVEVLDDAIDLEADLCHRC